MSQSLGTGGGAAEPTGAGGRRRRGCARRVTRYLERFPRATSAARPARKLIIVAGRSCILPGLGGGGCRRQRRRRPRARPSLYSCLVLFFFLGFLLGCRRLLELAAGRPAAERMPQVLGAGGLGASSFFGLSLQADSIRTSKA